MLARKLVVEPALCWYIVMTKPRAEWGVSRELRRLGYEVLYLHYMGTVSHANRKIAVIKPYFPRYLFVGLQAGQGLFAVNETDGVSVVLHGVNGPFVVPQAVVDDLRTRGNADGLIGGIERKPERARWEAGRRVRVKEGPLSGFLATVQVDNGPGVRILVEMFRGSVEADLPPDAITAA